MDHLFVVEYKKMPEKTTASLYAALRYIGKQIGGQYFGCMTITASAAIQAGYGIRITKEQTYDMGNEDRYTASTALEQLTIKRWARQDAGDCMP